MRLNFLLPVFAFLLTGCASVRPLPDHPGAYEIEKHVSVFQSDDGLSAERERMTEQATAFCARNNMTVEILDGYFMKNIPFWQHGSARLEFKCISVPMAM